MIFRTKSEDYKIRLGELTAMKPTQNHTKNRARQKEKNKIMAYLIGLEEITVSPAIGTLAHKRAKHRSRMTKIEQNRRRASRRKKLKRYRAASQS